VLMPAPVQVAQTTNLLQRTATRHVEDTGCADLLKNAANFPISSRPHLAPGVDAASRITFATNAKVT
jgi:hypothetical protein